MWTSRVWAMLFVFFCMTEVLAVIPTCYYSRSSGGEGLDCKGIEKQATTRRLKQCWSKCIKVVSNDVCRSKSSLGGLGAEDAIVIHKAGTNQKGCDDSFKRYLCSAASLSDGKCCDGSNPIKKQGRVQCPVPSPARAEYMNMGDVSAFDAREQYQEALAEFYYEEEVEEAREERADMEMEVKRSRLARLQSIAEQAEGHRAKHLRAKSLRN